MKKNKTTTFVINDTITGTAMKMAEEARYRIEMQYQMAKALVTGKLDSGVIKWAEMIIDMHEKEKTL